MISLIVLLFFSYASAGINPQGLLKANLFSLDGKIEAITDFSCEGALDPMDHVRPGENPEQQRKQLLLLTPNLLPYDPGALRTQEAKTVDFLNYLITEFTKLEKAAIINRTIARISPERERATFNSPRNLAGDVGRSYRLIVFLRVQAESIGTDYEPALKIFADAFFTPEIVQISLAAQHINNTRHFFKRLKENNLVLYLYFWEKYHPYTTEENLSFI